MQVEDVSFGYGPKLLFEKGSFLLNAGERATLVASNRVGKTTFLRLIAGELEPEEGVIVRKKKATVGYYRQSHQLSVEGNVLDALLSGFQPILGLCSQLNQLHQALESGGGQASLQRLAVLQNQYHLAQGDALEHRVAKIAHQLGFPPTVLQRPFWMR
ncbi:ATP-binding cassette domain-containing protein [Pajaroellobacter abortibovis]|uniref:ATP-binding cassette domain-containing protein n=1 Tax=Pajaroellobacter abortibovis TaxID=1882918 RepID=UPI001FE8A439|nr:ATP-binding cassette domain-containing protein [Pajaroellobacter abortibovis]